jgi:hypothetical protein
VSDFYKVLSYAFLYVALNNTLIKDLTLSIIETRHPRELFKHIEEQHGRITEVAPGIYHIAGYPLAIQVIESKKLSFEENLWLKGLTKDLSPVVAGSTLKESWKKDRQAELGAYLYVLILANLEVIQGKGVGRRGSHAWQNLRKRARKRWIRGPAGASPGADSLGVPGKPCGDESSEAHPEEIYWGPAGASPGADSFAALNAGPKASPAWSPVVIIGRASVPRVHGFTGDSRHSVRGGFFQALRARGGFPV